MDIQKLEELKNHIKEKNVKTFSELFNKVKINPEQTTELFKFSCDCNSVKIVKLLLSFSKNRKTEKDRNRIINIRTIKEEFENAYTNGNLKIVKFLLENYETQLYVESAFVFGCKNNEKLVKLILKIISYNELRNNRFFLFACSNGYTKIVKLFLSLNNIDIHFQNDDSFKMACNFGYLDIVELLLTTRERFNVQDFDTDFDYIRFLIDCLQTPIDFDERILEYKKQVQLMCVKQSLTNLCCVI